MPILTESQRKTESSVFLFNGGYDDRISELPPQQWECEEYRKGYVQAILDCAQLEDYRPVSY